MHQPLAMDKIIESCLILMVLLLLSCARHLIVDCTASVTHISHHHFQLRPLVGALCQIYFPSPSVPSVICLPSVIWSVTSPVIHRCDCKLWLFVLKHVNLVKVCQRSTPHKKNKIKHLNVMESWGWSPFGCYLTFCRPPPSRQMSCIHPFVHPSIHQLIISDATGLEIITIWITWRGDGYKEDRRPVTQVLWVETLTMLRRSASCPPPLPGSHTDPNVRCRQKHWQAGTDVAAWARSV